jgi:TonB family protein
VGKDQVTMQVVKPATATEQPKDVARPPQEAVLDAKPLASGALLMAGLPDAPSSLAVSNGIGSGGGAGDGRGTGLGSGIGSGVGAGFDRGFGGGVYRVGSGVTPPVVLKQVRPKYTPEALLRQLQGTVALELVVGRDGIPLQIRVIRSLDPGGLDEEAIIAVREWRFSPGRLAGAPVDVLVTILLDFRIV